MVPKISIIIPCKELNDYTRKCIKHCLNLDYPDFEIILLPDSKVKESFGKTRIIPTGSVKPALKRNIGVSEARSEICAFIDSDAYPRRDWLRNAVKYFENEKIGILGGPNLVPKEDDIYQKASDDILSSAIGAGSFALRYKVGRIKSVRELPSVNLFVKKSLFRKIGGFDVSFLTAEDAKFCFQVAQLGKDVAYVSDVIVYHHRRPLFRPHMKQMWIYGRDKARLLKRFFSSDKLLYFLPSLFVLFLFFGFVISFNPWFMISYVRVIYLSLILLYLIIAAITSLVKNLKRAFLIFPGIILTHVFYGCGFLYGLATKKSK